MTKDTSVLLSSMQSETSILYNAGHPVPGYTGEVKKGAGKALTGVSKTRQQNLLALVDGFGRPKILDRVPEIKSGPLSYYVSGQRGIGHKTARLIEEAFGKAEGDMDLPDWGQGSSTSKAKPIKGRQIKLIGDFDGTTVTAGKVAERVEFQSSDPGAFAMRVVLDWAQPRIKHGEVIVAEPNSTAKGGDLVVVKLSTGDYKLGYLVATRQNHVSINRPSLGGETETILTTKITSISPIVAILLRVE